MTLKGQGQYAWGPVRDTGSFTMQIRQKIEPGTSNGHVPDDVT